MSMLQTNFNISGALHTIYRQCADLSLRVCVCVGRAKTATAATKMFNSNNNINNKHDEQQQDEQNDNNLKMLRGRFWFLCAVHVAFL